MKSNWIMFAATLMLLVNVHADSEPSQKEQLITPTLWALAPDMFACNLTNVSHTSKKVEIRVITNGKILLESAELVLEPKHTTNHKVKGLEKGGPVYCEFTVEGSKEMYRGSAKLFHGPTSSDFAALPAQ